MSGAGRPQHSQELGISCISPTCMHMDGLHTMLEQTWHMTEACCRCLASLVSYNLLMCCSPCCAACSERGQQDVFKVGRILLIGAKVPTLHHQCSVVCEAVPTRMHESACPSWCRWCPLQIKGTNVGDVQKVAIRHDNWGLSPDWHCQQVSMLPHGFKPAGGPPLSSQISQALSSASAWPSIQAALHLIHNTQQHGCWVGRALHGAPPLQASLVLLNIVLHLMGCT